MRFIVGTLLIRTWFVWEPLGNYEQLLSLDVQYPNPIQICLSQRRKFILPGSSCIILHLWSHMSLQIRDMKVASYKLSVHWGLQQPPPSSVSVRLLRIRTRNDSSRRSCPSPSYTLRGNLWWETLLIAAKYVRTLRESWDKLREMAARKRSELCWWANSR